MYGLIHENNLPYLTENCLIRCMRCDFQEIRIQNEEKKNEEIRKERFNYHLYQLSVRLLQGI